jgi:pimeloyl-ACP methyl ester carboxylesterase
MPDSPLDAGRTLAWLGALLEATASSPATLVGHSPRWSDRAQERLFRGCFTDLDGLRRDMGDQWQPLAGYALERARRPELQVALRGLMPAFALQTIPAADLARLAMRVTLIWGRHDLQVRLRIAEAANERFGWPLYVIEECGDDPAFEQPAAFLHALHDAVVIQETVP